MTQTAVGHLLITNTDPRVWHAPLEPRTLVIGRHTECDIVIPPDYRSVSRRHAQVEFRNNSLWIQDLGSAGGTHLNGVPLEANRPSHLVVGDRLTLAGVELYVVSAESLAKRNENGEAERVLTGVETTDELMFGSGKSLESSEFSCLTPAELDVVRWIKRGLTTNNELGHKLFRSPNTIRTQMRSIFTKLNVHSREELLGLLKKAETAWTFPLDSDSLKTQPPQIFKFDAES